jgi:hypothetical protein
MKPPMPPALVRLLIPLSWTLLGVLAVAALVALVMALTDRTRSPEATSGLGVMAAVLLLVLVVVLAVLLNMATRRQSPAGLIALTLVLAWPLAVLVARPAVLAYRRQAVEREEGRVGDFTDPVARPMAQGIAASDTAALMRLLGGQPPPTSRDRAGNDLLAYAVLMVRDRHGSTGPLRVLLDAGADPRRSRVSGTLDVVNFIIRGTSPSALEALQVLLERGADPNAVDAETGKTPIAGTYKQPEMIRALVEHGADIDRVQPNGFPAIVDVIATQEWESALYLIEKGADLDVQNADGLSVDYYLKSWKDSVFGEHPEGWDRVRDAIARRRAMRPR